MTATMVLSLQDTDNEWAEEEARAESSKSVVEDDFSERRSGDKGDDDDDASDEDVSLFTRLYRKTNEAREKCYALSPSEKEKTQFPAYNFYGNDDKDLLLKAFTKKWFPEGEIPGILLRQSDRLRDDEDVVRLAMDIDVSSFASASCRWQDREDIAKRAVERHGSLLQYASARLQDKEETVMLAIQNDPSALEYASPRLRDDRDIVKMAIKESGLPVQFASCRLRDDKEIMKLAVTCDGSALQYASFRLKGRRDIVIPALRCSIDNFRYAAPEARAVVALVVIDNCDPDGFGQGCIDALSLVSDELKNDRKLNLLVAEKFGYFLNQECFGGDLEIALAALNCNLYSWPSITTELKGNIQIALLVVKKLPDAFAGLSAEMRGNREVVLEALEAEAKIYRKKRFDPFRNLWFSDISDNLKKDTGVIMKAMKANGLFLRDAILPGGSQDLVLATAAVSSNICALYFVPESLKNNLEISSAAIKATKYEHRKSWGGPTASPLLFVRKAIGEHLTQKLDDLCHEMESAVPNTIEPSQLLDVHQWSIKWNQDLWHKVWLLNKTMRSVAIPKDIRNTILEFSDIVTDFQMSLKMREIGPVVEALAECGISIKNFMRGRDEKNESVIWSFQQYQSLLTRSARS